MLAKLLPLLLLLSPGIRAAPAPSTSTPVNTCEENAATLMVAQWNAVGTVKIAPGTLSGTPGVTVRWIPDKTGDKLCKVDFWMGLENKEPPGKLNYAPGLFPKHFTPTTCVTTEWSAWYTLASFPDLLVNGALQFPACGSTAGYRWAFHAEAGSVATGGKTETGWTNQKVVTGQGSWGTYNSASCPCSCTSWGPWSTICNADCLYTATCQDTGKSGTVMTKPCTGCPTADPTCPAGWDDWGQCYQESSLKCVQKRSCPSLLKSETKECPCPPFTCTGTLIESACYKQGKQCLKSVTCSTDDTMVKYVSCPCQLTGCSLNNDCPWDQYCNAGTCTDCPADKMFHDCCSLTGRCKDSSCVALGFDNSAQSEWTAKQALDAGIQCPAIENCAGGKLGNPLLHCFSEVQCLNQEVTCLHEGEKCLQSGNSNNFKICKPPPECTENNWGPWSGCSATVRSRTRTCKDSPCLTQTGVCPDCLSFNQPGTCSLVNGMCMRTKTCSEPGNTYTEQEACGFNECDYQCADWKQPSGCSPAPDGNCRPTQACRGSQLTRFASTTCTCSLSCTAHEDCGRWWLGCYDGQCSECKNYFRLNGVIEHCCMDTKLCRDSSCTTFGFPNSAKANQVYSKAQAAGFYCPAVDRCSYLFQQDPSSKLAHCYSSVECTGAPGCPNDGELCLQDGNSNNFKVCKPDWSMECDNWASWSSCSWVSSSSDTCHCQKKRECAGKPYITETTSDGCSCNPECGGVTSGGSSVSAQSPISVALDGTTASATFTVNAIDHSNTGIKSITCTKTGGPAGGPATLSCSGSASCTLTATGLQLTSGTLYTYQCLIEDNVGNTNSGAPCGVWIKVTDTTPPYCGTMNPDTTSTSPYVVVLGAGEANREVTFTVNGGDNVAVASILCSPAAGTPPLKDTTACSGSTCTRTTTALSPSTSNYVYSCVITDTSGNSNTANPCKVYIKVEDTPQCLPTTSSSSGAGTSASPFLTVVPYGSTGTVTFTVSGTDNDVVASISCTLASPSDTQSCNAASCTFTSVPLVASQTAYKYLCTITDTKGHDNSGSKCEVYIKVEDTPGCGKLEAESGVTGDGTSAKPFEKVVAYGTSTTVTFTVNGNDKDGLSKIVCTSTSPSETLTCNSPPCALTTGSLSASKTAYHYKCTFTDLKGHDNSGSKCDVYIKVEDTPGCGKLEAESGVTGEGTSAKPFEKVVDYGKTTTLTFTLNGNDNDDVSTISCVGVSSAPMGLTTSCSSSPCTLTTGSLSAGTTYHYECTITDKEQHDNSGSKCQVYVKVEDNPTCSGITATGLPGSGTSTSPFLKVLASGVPSGTVTFKVTATDNDKVKSISCSPTTTPASCTSSTATSLDCTVTTGALTPSTTNYEYTCTVTDVENNMYSGSSCKVYIKVDDTPACHDVSLVPGSMVVSSDKFSFQWVVTQTGSDALSQSSYCTINGGTSITATTSCSSTSCSFQTKTDVAAVNGHIVISCVLLDTANNAAPACALDLTVGTGTAFACTAAPAKKSESITTAWNGDYNPKDSTSEDPTSMCFLGSDADTNRWGWVNTIASNSHTSETSLYMWMGAAHCYLSSGTYVGEVKFWWPPSMPNTLKVQLYPTAGAIFGEPHIYIGKSSVPKDSSGKDVTSAPGQYEGATKTAANFPTAVYSSTAPSSTQSYWDFSITNVPNAGPTTPYYLIVHIGGGYIASQVNEALAPGSSTATTTTSSSAVAIGVGVGFAVAVTLIALLGGIGFVYYRKTSQYGSFETMFDVPQETSEDHIPKENAALPTAMPSGYASDAVSPSGRVPLAGSTPTASS